MTKQKTSYKEAISELDEILASLERNDGIDMDLISAKVKRAAVLMEMCRAQLHEMDKELEKVLENLE